METVYFLTCEEERWWFVVGVGPKAVSRKAKGERKTLEKAISNQTPNNCCIIGNCEQKKTRIPFSRTRFGRANPLLFSQLELNPTLVFFLWCFF